MSEQETKRFRYTESVSWKRGQFYGTDWPDEVALVVQDPGKDQVQILCLDGEVRWVKRENIQTTSKLS